MDTWLNAQEKTNRNKLVEKWLTILLGQHLNQAAGKLKQKVKKIVASSNVKNEIADKKIGVSD